MGNNIKGFIITLDKDIREDDAAAVRQALEMIRGVIAVDESVVDVSDLMNRRRVTYEIRHKLFKTLEGD